jgi:hypothetical protein
MQRPPRTPTMLTYYCGNERCGAMLGILVPGTLLYDTRFYCPLCQSTTKIIKEIDRTRSKEYTILQPA